MRTYSEFLPDGLQFVCSLCQICICLRQSHPLDLNLTEYLQNKKRGHIHTQSILIMEPLVQSKTKTQQMNYHQYDRRC